ncbi:hypothetical protein [Butyricicoccus pullicaecorum]|uniref:hypothetical protein n=1 Tax=Butyricicoccus pullicaecorum TaxID=501571 RepID=UPI000590E020|nr:hypothetical protein [Butyricicoccus pullicaecorum]
MIWGGWGVRKSGFGERERVSDWERVGVGEEREKGGNGKDRLMMRRSFYEPCGFRKYPGGVFSRNLADLKNIPVEYFSARLWLALPTKPDNLCSDETAKDSQAMNGKRKVSAVCGRRLCFWFG